MERQAAQAMTPEDAGGVPPRPGTVLTPATWRPHGRLTEYARPRPGRPGAIGGIVHELDEEALGGYAEGRSRVVTTTSRVGAPMRERQPVVDRWALPADIGALGPIFMERSALLAPGLAGSVRRSSAARSRPLWVAEWPRWLRLVPGADGAWQRESARPAKRGAPKATLPERRRLVAEGPRRLWWLSRG